MKCLLLLLALCATTSLCAQPVNCDRITLRTNDTLVCSDVTRKGQVYRERFYLHGQLLYCRWWHYRRNGEYEWSQRKSKSAFAKNNGPAYWYYPNGQLKTKVTFVNNHKVGDCLSYYPDGKPWWQCHHNSTGKKDGTISLFYPNGQLAWRAVWVNGRVMEILDNKDEDGADLLHTVKNGNGEWHTLERIYTVRNGKTVKSKKVKR